MEETVDKLEALFQKAESDINYVSRKLDSEFTEMSDESNQVNPKEIVERLQSVKQQYSDIVKEAEEIKKAQSEASEFFRSQLQMACQALQKIQDQAGADPQEQTEEDKMAEAMLGLNLSQTDETQESKHYNTRQSSEDFGGEYCEGACAIADALPSPAVEAESAAELRKNGEFVDISKDEFMSVSSLIRGRVKLADVNKIYQMLYTHFKEEATQSH
uniref:Protein FAM33A n=1 Tax=Saccoglossus kowalevskii TaxID=10224 RepID=A0ABM0GT64_SACKO|nr:PREDICTED: spindle and kinetochore-associated protein 2-like [Saccoglossus kowalevskii]